MSRRPPSTLDAYAYELPSGLIAQVPTGQRGESRLLHVDGIRLSDLRFVDLPRLLREGDLLVFNDTRVIKARIRGRKATGGEVEMLLERVTSATRGIVQLRASHPPKPGQHIDLPGGARASVVGREGRFYELQFDGVDDLFRWLESHGEVPLPPYIHHPPNAEDEARYQTIYARHPGAVAAPTAGLHFDDALLRALDARGIQRAFITLHVGAGTFQPVQTNDIAAHRMHAERFAIPEGTVTAIANARAAGGRIVAVGTTSLRALEAAADERGDVRAGAGETSLFITPGYRFRVVERLVTNFHLPKSTLLMLVSAFAGYDAIRAAYAHAIAKRYRFMSYGDAMFLTRADDEAR
ncbi:MAG TPA: tRNA preQ1(34) S-adenosylmethionine ribosyltransferase-isomerase QueA [Acidimicrobiia bacterium]|nr:tRNA preQ1(34) S-adenosylmethionine ribosyltransferase-isomerase QueA [Acidimicrobiia bacterium]